MTVDTVVKIGESEKCALDMSSYEDLNSASRNVGGDGDGDGKDDYVFVNGSDAVVLDDRVVNRVNGEVNGDHEGEGVSEVELSVEGGGGSGVKVNGDVALSEDYVENHENKEASEVKLSVEGDDLVESHEVNEAELSVEGGGNVEVSDDVVLSDDLVENCENEGKVSVDGDGDVVLSDDRVENHENKDVKVYDDVVLSDDRVENHDDREVNVAELSVEGDDNVVATEDVVLSDDHVIGEVSLEEVDSVKINGDAETDILDKEVEREVDGVGSVVEIGEINSGNEVVHAANGIIPEHVVDEVTERNDPKPVVDDVKEAESVVKTGDNGNASVDIVDSRSLDSAEVKAEDNAAVNEAPDALDTSEVKEGSVPEPVVDEVRGGIEPESVVVDDVKEVDAIIGAIGSRSLDVDDNNTRTDFVTQESAEVESEDSTAVNGVPDAPEFSEIEAQIKAPIVEVPEGGLEEEQQTVPSVENGTENNGDVHTELEPADYPVMESEHLKADGNDQSIDNGLLDDANATPVEESPDLQQEHIPSVDGENEKRHLIEVEANTDRQGDVVEPVAGGEIQESVDSEVVGSELDQCEKGENRDQTGLDSLSSQSEGAQNQGNLELAAREMDNPVSVIAGQSDERKTELTAENEENGEALIGMQFDTADKPALEDEREIVNGVAESEVITETGGIQGALKDHVTEQTRSFDVVDKDISSVDCSLDQNDEGGSYARENAAESKDAPASEESSEEAGNGLSPDSLNSVAESSAPSESENVKEQGVGNDISAADNSLSDSAFDTKSNSETDVAIKTNTIFDGTSRPGISFGSFGSGPPLSYNEINSRSEVLNKHTAVSTPRDGVVLTSPANGDHSDGLNHDSTCSQVARSEKIDEVSASSVEGSEADSSDARNGNPDLVRKPFYWLIKVPRFDEEKYKEELRQSEIELAEKTKARDACQAEFNKQQAYCRELRSDLEAANSEAKPARELLWAKSRELDPVHSSLNLARHGITTEDLDNKIHNLEHRMQHQTLNNLREEKELVREIKQLNLQRQKLSADPERLQAIQQARAQRDQTEDQLKVLKKESNALKENLAKAEDRFRAARKKLNDESVLLNDLKDQLRSANDIRQEAYIRLITLRKQLNEKNTPFFKAKNDLRIAYNYATAGNKDGLEHHCVNQVEKIMEMWNKNDEFRKEYVQANMARTLWKFATPDGIGRSIDEESSLGDLTDRRVNSSAKANPVTDANSAPEILTRETDLHNEAKPTEDKPLKKGDQKAATPVKKIEAISKTNLAEASDIIEIEEAAEKPKLTKEEEELAKKAEQLKREEEAARLMEQRRLEEKVKAEEALERKRRNALKAQARAEFKARKEAEEKEKEREKRAKKKGKKRGINIEITENEPAQPSEPSSESVKESEVTEKLATKAKRPQKAPSHSKQIKTTKPIPAALRNKGKRGLLHYWPYALIVLLAIALFYLGSYERIQTIRQHISALLHR